jgi:hypothetical protein
MIPAVITDTSIMFFARGRPWTLAEDHPKFGEVKVLLRSGTDDADRVVMLCDVRVAVEVATGGQAVLTEEALLLNGRAMSQQWREKATAAPDSMKVLLVHQGDEVRVEGDDDAPDGIYEVGEIDENDINRRVMVTSDLDYFGYVANTSIKEITKMVPRPPVEEQLPAVQEPLEDDAESGCPIHDTCDSCSEELECGQTGHCDECIEAYGDEDE